MRVFVYEFVTGGGMWSLGERPEGSLLTEGRAMASAVCHDFSALGMRVSALADSRLLEHAGLSVTPVDSPEAEHLAFMRLAAAADWTLVIAPETGGSLLRRCQWVKEAGGRLLASGAATVALASDKHATAAHLTKGQVRVPRGVRLGVEFDRERLDQISFPAVIKPLDGCGSQGVRRIDSPAELHGIDHRQDWRLECLAPGMAASVAILCGPGLLVALPACEQLLSPDGRFAYLGGRTPLPAALADRARRLALAAVGTLPDPLGYIGVDLVLGNDAEGREDQVIEINPRLTTSYVGLRALCRTNLAQAMLDVASGREPALSWHDQLVEFSADGGVVVRPRRPPKREALTTTIGGDR